MFTRRLLRFSLRAASFTFRQRGGQMSSSGTRSKAQLLKGPQLSHPTCSLAQAEVRRSDRGEPQHAGTTVHRGRHTGSPAGPAAALLAHGHAAEGQSRSHTMVHCGSFEDPAHTQVHKHTLTLSCEQ